MKTRNRNIVTFLEGQVIGTMYLSATGEAYLNYCYKSEARPIDLDEEDTDDSVSKIAHRSLLFCQDNGYDLIMY